jgi:DNA-binding NarL/FixJ family response regulator
MTARAPAGAASTVLVVDDQALIACSIALALRGVGIAAAAVPPERVVELAARPAPHGGLVLLDLDRGADVTVLVARLCRAGWRVLLVTGSAAETAVGSAVAAGAVGRVHKSRPFEDLVRMATLAAQGRSVLDPIERNRLIALADAATLAARREHDRWDRLTPREREIVDRIAEGRRPASIAEEFVVSLATVRSHIRSILAKLGVGSQLEVAALARARLQPARQPVRASRTAASLASASRTSVSGSESATTPQPANSRAVVPSS